MAQENSFLVNASSYFAKIMQLKFITKAHVLQLKGQLKQLKQQNVAYTKLFNKVTRIANNAEGKNSPSILENAYKEFQTLML